MKRLVFSCGGKRMPRIQIEISLLGIFAIVLMIYAIKNLVGGGATARLHGIIEMLLSLVLAVYDAGFWRPRSR